MAKTTAATQTTSAHQVVITAMAELIGVSIAAIIADSSEAAGKVVVGIMIGWLLIWLMASNGGLWVSQMTKKL